MNTEGDGAGIEKYLSRLSIAASVIAFVLVVQLLYSVLVLVAPKWFMDRFETTRVEHSSATNTPFGSEEKFDPESDVRWTYRDFHNWSHERQIQEASVIARAQYQEEGDDVLEAVLVEILKQTPGTTFFYQIGDTVQHMRLTREPGRRYGDGAILYFVGDPATFIASSHYYGERLPSRGDMSISQLKDVIRSMQSGP